MIAAIINNLKIDLLKIVKEMGVEEAVEVIFDVPKDAGHGDYATNLAMRLAKPLRKSPVAVAQDIKKRLDLKHHHLEKVEVAGPGFINFYLDEVYLAQIIPLINEKGSDYGKLDIGDEAINLEFVSANPTGYLHIGHGRGAAYGDSLARIMRKAGFNVSCEHYVNDAGNQINNLAYSIYERYKECCGLPSEMKEGYYFGKEIITIAKNIYASDHDAWLHKEWYQAFRYKGVEVLLNGLKTDLATFNVHFDTWFSEQSLYDQNLVKSTLDSLIKNGHTYESEGAVWLKSSQFGDEKDRVLVKSDGTLTYITPDIAYHVNKFNRGFDHLIDVLGADHHGYIGRLRAALAMMGKNPDKIDIEILQMVRIIQNGEELKMSKRSGKAITLRDLIDEVGVDALRFFYVSKALSSHMDLDLDLAIKQSNDNPVYYVQYAYARIASLFRMIQEQNRIFTPKTEFNALDLQKVSPIIRQLLQYPEVIKEAATKRIPHRVASYALQLATVLHSFYNDEKIITDDLEETNEKLSVMMAVQIVLKDSLNLIGVGVKEKM
ncbi:MAG: arginine--tRNA ligase [Bacilli bacterium]|nr:arginine--tRNA ligase [Bacilli bacterium]